MSFHIISLFLIGVAPFTHAGWSAANYPHPEHEYEHCNVQEPSQICDPDLVLTEHERTSINFKLQLMNSATTDRRDGKTGCSRQGLRGYVAVLNELDHAESIQTFSREMLKTYTATDPQRCEKQFLYVLVADSRKFQLNIAANAGLEHEELIQLTNSPDVLKSLEDKRYGEAITKLLASIQDEYNKKIGNYVEPETTTAESEITTTSLFDLIVATVTPMVRIRTVRPVKMYEKEEVKDVKIHETSSSSEEVSTEDDKKKGTLEKGVEEHDDTEHSWLILLFVAAILLCLCCGVACGCNRKRRRGGDSQPLPQCEHEVEEVVHDKGSTTWVPPQHTPPPSPKPGEVTGSW